MCSTRYKVTIQIHKNVNENSSSSKLQQHIKQHQNTCDFPEIPCMCQFLTNVLLLYLRCSKLTIAIPKRCQYIPFRCLYGCSRTSLGTFTPLHLMLANLMQSIFLILGVIGLIQPISAQYCISCRNQSFDLLRKTNDKFLYKTQRWAEIG